MRWLAGLRCGRVRKRRWRYLDNTLSPRERAWVDRHLAWCIGCRAEFARAAFALESLQKGLPLEASLLPARPQRWWMLAPLLIALLGLIGGIGLVRLSRLSSLRSQPAAINGNQAAIDQTSMDSNQTAIDRDQTVMDSNQMATESDRTANDSHQKSANHPAAAARWKPPAQSGKRSPRHHAVSPAPMGKPASAVDKSPMPEGVIEVYDESGQLVKREQMRGTR